VSPQRTVASLLADIVALPTADSEMAGRHRVRPRSIHIIRTDVIPSKQTKRAHIWQFMVRCSGPRTTLAPRKCSLFAHGLGCRTHVCVCVVCWVGCGPQNAGIKFPLPHRRVTSQFQTRFVAKRPSTFLG
jgi:large subunit ribosomal protein L18Ae